MNTYPDILFSHYSEFSYPIRRFNQIDYLRRVHTDQLTKVKTYFRDNIVRLDSTNILVDILNNIDIIMSYDGYRYSQYLMNRAEGLSRTLKITSSFSHGEIHTNAFYGKGCDEILLLDLSPFDVEKAEKFWKNLAPVYPLLHPWSDFGYLLPTGGDVDSGKGLSSIAIHIPMLAFQYRCFLKEKIRLNDTITASPEIFLMQYVFPNMLNQQIDLVVLNRLMNLFYDRPMSKNLIKLPMAIYSYADKVDDLLQKVLDRLKDNRLFYVESLLTIPSLFSDNMDRVLKMPDIPNTNQVWWALVLSRMSIVKFLIDLGGQIGVTYNQYYLAVYRVDLTYLLSQKTLERYLPSNLLEETMIMADSILKT
jgi:hypothetical protein